MKRLIQIALIGVGVLAVASMAAAQARPPETLGGQPQPVVRFGNFTEVGNDVFMHILGTADIRYQAVHNFDFEDRVRDRVPARNPLDTREQSGDYTGLWNIIRFGVDFRYQKNLQMELLLEERPNADQSSVRSRFNSTNPGGTDIFGRAATTENNGPEFIVAYVDYKFAGTPLRLRAGWDLSYVDQAGLVGDRDPRFSLFGDFGDFDVRLSAVRAFSGQRLGLNSNDMWYYVFSGGYNLKPHRFQFDVVYFQDRFNGADRQLLARTGGGLFANPNPLGVGFVGQKTDSILLMGSWSGRVGPVRGLVQGNLLTGWLRGGTRPAELPPGVVPGRKYDLLAGAVVAYGEVDLGVVRPFVSVVFGTGDGDPRDRKLHGFNPQSFHEITLITGTPWFAHLDTSQAVAARDYTCPARMQGLGTLPNQPSVANPATPGAPGLTRRPENIGTNVLLSSPGIAFVECGHTVGSPFNDRIGDLSHLGLETPYSNPGTLLIPVGLRVFPLKGHELTGWYAYKGWLNSKVLNVAFAPERAARGIGGIRTTQYHEIGGSWLWTLNPNFDIRLSGDLAIAGGAYRDLAHLAICDPGGIIPAGQTYATATPCGGKNLATHAEVRFRGRF